MGERDEPTTDILGRSSAAEPSMLLIGDGERAIRYSLRDRPVAVGSNPSNDLVIPDRAVSGRHCRLSPEGRGWVVRDLRSRNGTFVNGLSVREAELRPGSRLQIGRTVVRPVGLPAGAEHRSSFVAVSAGMLAALGEVDRYATLDWPVLILGESGTGKEGVARALHERGPRHRGSFVAINAGGMPRHLIESELFGHERGAFTGAVDRRKGMFELASGGTLFLDEIGELPLDLQARLLRVLENGEIRRVGAEKANRVDVRVVCATHRDLRAAETFRSDLYFRLARLVVRLPPLRRRVEDIGPLGRHFLNEILPAVGPVGLSEGALAVLRRYPWPGNVRELRNVVCAAAAVSGTSILEAPDVERAIRRLAGEDVAPDGTGVIMQVVERCDGNLAEAARQLGMPRTTLRDRLRGVRRTSVQARSDKDRDVDCA